MHCTYSFVPIIFFLQQLLQQFMTLLFLDNKFSSSRQWLMGNLTHLRGHPEYNRAACYETLLQTPTRRRRGMQSTQHCWLITLWLPLSMWQINTWETLLIRKLHSSIRALREPEKMSFSLHCKRDERSWSDKIDFIFCCVLKSLLKSLNRQLVLVDESPSHSNVRICRGCYHSDIYIFAHDYLLIQDMTSNHSSHEYIDKSKCHIH